MERTKNRDCTCYLHTTATDETILQYREVPHLTCQIPSATLCGIEQKIATQGYTPSMAFLDHVLHLMPVLL